MHVNVDQEPPLLLAAFAYYLHNPPQKALCLKRQLYGNVPAEREGVTKILECLLSQLRL